MRHIVCIGTYADQIHVCDFDEDSGALQPRSVYTEARQPSYLIASPDGRVVYAVEEVDDVEPDGSGAVTAMRFDDTSCTLTHLNRVPSNGSGPCHLALDKTGRYLFVANYGGGTVAMLPVADDGSLLPASCVIEHRGSGADPKRQEGPHVHGVFVSADNRHLLVADLGLDRVFVYPIDLEQGRLRPATEHSGVLEPGQGPRHLALHPSGTAAYVVSELDNTITHFDYDAARGGLHRRGVISTVPGGQPVSNLAAAIAIDSRGRFLYASNRGHDSIVVCELEPQTFQPVVRAHVPTGGAGSAPEGREAGSAPEGREAGSAPEGREAGSAPEGRKANPRDFSISPCERYILVANEGSGSVKTLRIGGENEGAFLSATGHELAIEQPVCVQFLPQR